MNRNKNINVKNAIIKYIFLVLPWILLMILMFCRDGYRDNILDNDTYFYYYTVICVALPAMCLIFEVVGLIYVIKNFEQLFVNESIYSRFVRHYFSAFVCEIGLTIVWLWAMIYITYPQWFE